MAYITIVLHTGEMPEGIPPRQASAGLNFSASMLAQMIAPREFLTWQLDQRWPEVRDLMLNYVLECAGVVGDAIPEVRSDT